MGNQQEKDIKALEEVLDIIEKLKQEGIDINFLPNLIDGKYATLQDIECPKIGEIIEKLGLNPNYPIGQKLIETYQEYLGTKNDYNLGEKECEEITKLGIFNSAEENVQQTLEILEQLKSLDVDLSTVGDLIEGEDENKRGRFLYEVEDEKIEEAIDELNLPRYMLIGKRFGQIKRYIERTYIDKTKRNDVKRRLKRVIRIKNGGQTDRDIHLTLKIFDELERHGVDISQIPVHKLNENGRKRGTLISDLEIEGISDILQQFNISQNFPIGLAINDIFRFYSKWNFDEREDLSDEDKEKIKKYYLLKEDQKKKTVTQETIKLIEKLQEYGIDLTTMSLSFMENGKQKFLRLNNLSLSEEQLEEIMEEFDLSEDFAIGNRINNVLRACRGKESRVSVTDEQKEKFAEWGMLEYRVARYDYRVKRMLDIFYSLKEAGVDISNLKISIRINEKCFITSLGLLDMDPVKKQEIMTKFSIDESFLIGTKYKNLKSAYKKGEMGDKEKKAVEELGIVSELDKLELEQAELAKKMEEVQELKSEIKSVQNNKGKSEDISR